MKRSLSKSLGSTFFVLLASSTMAAESTKPAEPKRIEDNSFNLEEAYNQEPAVIQHISFFQYLKKAKAWVYTFTEEWPFVTQAHQVSVTLPVQKTPSPEAQKGIGDLSLNYRYQIVNKSDIAAAPRLSLFTPTGDYKKGLGKGAVGFQFNLPVSVLLSDNFVNHWNLGFTYTPRAKDIAGNKANLRSINYGTSIIWLAKTYFNVMLETYGTYDEAVTGAGTRESSNSFFISPGARFALDFDSGLQIVPGFAVPIGLASSSKNGERA